MIVVMKVTKSCNLRCRYCYMDLDTGSSIKIMSPDVVAAVIEKFGGAYEYVDYSWHGGEPSLAGIDYYRQVIEQQDRFYKNQPSKRFKNSFQTNGLLFSDKWLDFLVESNFSLGFSYDGPEPDDGHNRVFSTAKPAGPVVRDIIIELRKRRGYVPGVICVVSKTNIDRAVDIYSDFKDVGITSFSLLPYQGQKTDLRISSREYFLFHKEMFDCWVNDSSSNKIKQIIPFEHIISSLIGGCKTICSWDGRCFKDLIAVEPDGGVFLCSSLHNPEHKLGNILEDSLQDILSSKTYLSAILQQDSVLAECKECGVFEICNGGCREASYFTHGRIDSRDPNCEGRKALVEYILDQCLSNTREMASQRV